MTLHLKCLAVGFFFAVPAFAAPPDGSENPAPANDPLPEGAKVRYGTSRPILRNDPSVALLPPTYTNFLAPTMTGGVRRYDLGTGRPLEEATNLQQRIGPGRVIVSCDGTRAAVARAGLLNVVDVTSGKPILVVKPPVGVIIVGTPGVSLSADGKILAYGGRGKDGKGEVVVLDLDRKEVLAQVKTALTSPVFPMLSRDGKTLATYGPPMPAPTVREANAAPPPTPPVVDPDLARLAQVWDVASGSELCRARVTGMGGQVVAAAFSPDGNILAISAGDGPVDLWDVHAGKRVQTLLGRKAQGVRVAFSPDGKTVASVGPDYRIQRWMSDGKPLDVTEAPGGQMTAPITGLEFVDNERVYAWMTAHQFCVAWEAPTGRLVSPVTDHISAIRSIAMPDGIRDLYSSGVDGRVTRWDLASGVPNETIPIHPPHIPGQPLVRPVLNLTDDATRGTWLRTPVEVFDLANGRDLYHVPPPSAPLSPVSFGISGDGTKLALLSRQTDQNRFGRCTIWNLMTQQRVAEFDVTPSTGGTPIGALSPDGSRLAVMTNARNAPGNPVFMIFGYDVKTGKKLAEVEDPGATGTLTILAVDDTTAVLSSTSGRIWSVDFANGQINEDIDRLATRGETISRPLAFSPDGKLFATAVVGEILETYGVRVYDLATKKPLQTFIGHVGPVSALKFTPDGKFLASGAQDSSVILWDLNKQPQGK